MLRVRKQGVENFCRRKVVACQSCRERNENGAVLPKGMGVGDERGRLSMRDHSLKVCAAEQSDDRSSHRTAVPERPVPEDAGVGCPPVNAPSNKLENTRGAWTISSGPTVTGGEAASDIILVDGAACDQRFSDVERHLGIVRPPQPAVRGLANNAPEGAFERPALVGRAERVP